jgi:uncharacterized secreted protein with C-terminal beta-propeller domain
MVTAMQREIKRRAQIYGIIAVLSAIILGSLCYNLGIVPQETIPPISLGPLKTFSSDNELTNFLITHSRFYEPYPFFSQLDLNFLGPIETFRENAQSLRVYSTTNVQVAGVDETDIVKSDGEYLYVISSNNVFILKAYPTEEAEVISKLTFNDSYLAGIFITHNRLAVLGCMYPIYQLEYYYKSFIIDVRTFVSVYDISNRTNPIYLGNFTISGSYFNSRKIGDYVYFVVSQPAYIIHSQVIVPVIYAEDGSIKKIDASQIYYANVSDEYFQYTTVVALNMQNTAEEPTYKTILMGGTSSMYVSLNNIYITFPEFDGNTTIYRIRIENSTIIPEAKGAVSGRELNQFSMDEYENYFRIATTTRVNGITQNNLYTLDMNLSIVGSLENITLAYGEQIDSARFIGNRCYLSTSPQQVPKDPFLVIDVENASEPEVLGYLKIPGFTRYLHPYDENHLIGVGRDETGNVKITIYDVSNVSAPVNVTEYRVSATWSNTLVLTEHKAFLFEKSKDLLVIPIEIHDAILWQGVYVFNVTLSGGLQLRGNVTHQDTYYWDYSYWVQRALYIENVLYTISERKVKMNSLEDLSEKGEIPLL